MIKCFFAFLKSWRQEASVLAMFPDPRNHWPPSVSSTQKHSLTHSIYHNHTHNDTLEKINFITETFRCNLLATLICETTFY